MFLVCDRIVAVSWQDRRMILEAELQSIGPDETICGICQLLWCADQSDDTGLRTTVGMLRL